MLPGPQTPAFPRRAVSLLPPAGHRLLHRGPSAGDKEPELPEECSEGTEVSHREGIPSQQGENHLCAARAGAA